MEAEANSQQNTQTQLMANKINTKVDHNKFDQHFGQVKRNNAATKRRDANTYEALITIQPKKIRKTPIASHRQNCSKKVNNHKKAQPFDLFWRVLIPSFRLHHKLKIRRFLKLEKPWELEAMRCVLPVNRKTTWPRTKPYSWDSLRVHLTLSDMH